MPPPSSTERLRLPAHWVVDTLAADEAIDFSVIKVLVDLCPQFLVGAPDAVEERVALRGLKEFATFADAAEGGAAVAPPASKIRVDAVCSCKDLLAELTGQVGSSGILDKDIILPLRQDIQNFICIKKPTLPESSLELLEEVDPGSQSMAAPSSVEPNGIKKHDNHESLCNVHHLNSNIDTPRPPIAITELQPGSLTNLVNNLEKGNFKQCPIGSAVDLDKTFETDRRFYNQPREYAINVASVSTRTSEKDPSNVDSNMSGSSTSCNATLQGNIAEPLSKKSMVDETTVVQAQPCKGKSPYPPDYNNVIKRPNDDGISYQSSRDPRNESKILQATMTPDFDRSNVLPTITSEASYFPEPIATEDTTMVQQLHSCKSHLNHLQHDSGQKANQDLDGTASIQPVDVFKGNIAEPLSEKSMGDETAVVQEQPCKGKSPNPPDYNNVIKRPTDDGISYQSSKDPRNESKTLQAMMAPAFDRSNDVLPTITSEARNLPEPIATEDTTMVQQLHSCKTHLNHLQHDSGQKANQDLDGTASIQPVEKYSIHEESTLQDTSVIPSVSCNGAMQEEKSKTNYPSGNTTEHTAIFEEQSCDKSQLEVSYADKNKHALHDDATMLGKNKVFCGGLNVQGAPEFDSCNLTLHDKISEAHCLSDQNIGKSTNGIQKCSCNISVSVSCQDGYRKTEKEDSNEQTIGKTVAETSHAHSSDDSTSGFAAACLLSLSGKIPLCRQDQEANDSFRVSPEQDLCRKCGKAGQLLQCSSCLLSAHDSCFGSSVAFEDPGQLYCPVCICARASEDYKKTKKTYIETRKSLAAFLGAEQLLKQHEQQTRLLPRAVYSEGQLNLHNSSKKQTSVSKKSNGQRKKQKINVTSDAFNEVIIEKASSVGNSDVASMNDSVLQNKSNQLQDAEQDHVENTEAHQGSSSQNRCSPAANPEVETDKEDGPTHSHHQSKNSDEIEFTSSSDSDKPSSPPWRTIKHLARLREREATVSSNFRKAFGQKDQHMPSPLRKQKCAYPPKRYSNPAVPTGRRSRLCWTVKEEAALREAMKKFTPHENGAIPWVQILEHGRNVFHRTRLPSDLRVKWRNMKNKGDS